MLGVIHEEREPDTPLPAWDRTVDVEWHRYVDRSDGNTSEKSKHTRKFAQTLSKFRLTADRDPDNNAQPQSRYFQLPDEIRLRVAQLLIADHDPGKPILMNMRGAELPAWSPSSFAAFAPLLRALEPCLTTCFDLRADVMTALLMAQRFHLVFGPYVRPSLNPLATRFATRYAPCMQLVTLELDFARLGFGPSWDAAGLAPGNLGVGTLVDDWVGAMLERNGSAPMDNLTLLCRRFYGSRPGTDPPLPYVPIAAFTSADGIGALAGLIDSVRIAGFSEAWTTAMIRHLWGANMPHSAAERSTHLVRHTPSRVWPLLPGQAARLDYGPGYRRRSSGLRRSETTGRVVVRGGSGGGASPPSYLLRGLEKRAGGGWKGKTVEEDERDFDEGVVLSLGSKEEDEAGWRGSWSPRRLQRKLSTKGKLKR
ncbi:hypothetical protein NKR23_g3739 [Pleurostoma richardsiae]|uniref:Uncharacterized protein n=1 Tax=Pleurostoma richardsiae TaxID=41990 RepID=A0AA38RLU5_9PEZI|nr:hypothetical protein NKR23_g3739 [Pleurostoma richardsiae]